MGEKHGTGVLWTLVPIVFGTTLCTFHEAAFDTVGFSAALGSTLIFTLQNIYSKKLFRDKRLHPLTLLMTTSSISTLLLFPVWLYTDFGALRALGGYDPMRMLSLTAVMGFSHWLQNLAAFIVLSMVSAGGGAIRTFSKQLTMRNRFRRSPTRSATLANAFSSFSGTYLCSHRFHCAQSAHTPRGSSIIVFANAVSSLNAIGMSITLTGAS